MQNHLRAIVIVACGAVAIGAVAAPPTPQEYLDSAISALRANHVNRDKVDWPALEAAARRLAKDADTTSETWPAIRHVIAALGEKHTSFDAPSSKKAASTPPATDKPRALPEVARLNDKFGYVRVTQFAGSREAGRNYADTLRDGIHRLAEGGACGWVVDLRGNSGGNVWPMFDGVAPLLGDGHVLTFDVPAQGRFRVLMKDGVAFQEGGAVPYKLEAWRALVKDDAPVAILTDGATASSAEAVAIAFAGRLNVRRFGAPTSGYITANMPVVLADGARINMTVGWNVDRTGRRYEDPLAPDEATDAEAALLRAQSWLAAQPACRPADRQRHAKHR